MIKLNYAFHKNNGNKNFKNKNEIFTFSFRIKTQKLLSAINFDFIIYFTFFTGNF